MKTNKQNKNSKEISVTYADDDSININIFDNKIYKGSLKFYGQEEKLIFANNIKVIPYQKQELPSAALGWLGGGDIAVSQNDQSGTKTKESFFEVRATIEKNKNIILYHGRSGILKVKLESKTLIDRLIISLNQILQKHYKI